MHLSPAAEAQLCQISPRHMDRLLQADKRHVRRRLYGRPKPGDELFVAFRDATTGRETYEVGRYLFIPFGGADGSYVLDFNLATNPLCNYSPHYNCPIPLRENTLPVAIRAGEMAYPARLH